MRRRTHALHKKLRRVIQRRDHTVLEQELVPKKEFVLFVRLSELQKRLYSSYLQSRARADMDEGLFDAYQKLYKVWTHPDLLRIQEEQRDTRNKAKKNSGSGQMTLAGAAGQRGGSIMSSSVGKTVTFGPEDNPLGVMWEPPIGERPAGHADHNQSTDVDKTTIQVTEVTVKKVSGYGEGQLKTAAYLKGVVEGDRLRVRVQLIGHL